MLFSIYKNLPFLMWRHQEVLPLSWISAQVSLGLGLGPGLGPGPGPGLSLGLGLGLGPGVGLGLGFKIDEGGFEGLSFSLFALYC